MSGKDQEKKKEKPAMNQPEAPLNKLDSLKMDIREVINMSSTKKHPAGLQKFISQHVQEEMTSAQTPAIKSGMFFLSSLMHQPRHEFYTQLIDTLREEMLNKIQELSGDINNPATVNKLRECLRAVFKMIHYPELQPVVMKLMDTIGGKLRSDETAQAMEILSMDKNLYIACPLGVKRRIWKQHPDMFLGEIFPMLNEYRTDCEAVIHATDRAFLNQMPKERRKRELVVKLVDMVGESSFLYSRLVGCLREVYHRTHCSHYCTLRAEILLSLNDRKLTTLCNQDDTHHFAWVLDACVRDRWIDAKRAKELEACYTQVPEKNSRDIRMLCSDPHAIHTICISIIRAIEEFIDGEQLPKLSSSLRFLYILLSIGVKIPSQEIHMTEFQTSLIPRIASLIANATYVDELHDLDHLRKQKAAEMANDSGRQNAHSSASSSNSNPNDKGNGSSQKHDKGDDSKDGKTNSVQETELADLSPELLPAKRAKICRDSYIATRVSQTLLQHHCLYAVEKNQIPLANSLFEVMNGMEVNQIRPEILQGIYLLSPEDSPWRNNSLFSYMRDKLLFRTPVAPTSTDRNQAAEDSPSTSGASSGGATTSGTRAT